MISFVSQKVLIRSTALNYQAIRPILTNAQIGLDRYLKFKNSGNNFANKEILKSNIQKSIEGNGFVYTDDLKSLAYLVDTKEDVKLLKNAFIKFVSNDDSKRLDNFKVGPVICRALFHMDDLESCKELFENESTSKHLNLRTAQNVYLTLLFKNEKYDEILNFGDKIFDQTFESDSTIGLEIERTLIVYLAAACKIGNKDALEKSRKLLNKFKENPKANARDKVLSLKHIMLYHLLCVKNNNLDEAYEAISQIKTIHHEFLNAKAAIQIRLGRIEDCLRTINKILEPNQENVRRYIFTETIKIINQELEKNPNEELKAKIDSLGQDVILDAKIEDTILALPNSPSPGNNFRKGMNNDRFNYRRDGFNRFSNRSDGSGFRQQNNRFNNRFNNRLNDDFNMGSKRSFRPFQTRFRAEGAPDFI